jgi:hypothetical protein
VIFIIYLIKLNKSFSSHLFPHAPRCIEPFIKQMLFI